MASGWPLSSPCSVLFNHQRAAAAPGLNWCSFKKGAIAEEAVGRFPLAKAVEHASGQEKHFLILPTQVPGILPPQVAGPGTPSAVRLSASARTSGTTR